MKMWVDKVRDFAGDGEVGGLVWKDRVFGKEGGGYGLPFFSFFLI